MATLWDGHLQRMSTNADRGAWMRRWTISAGSLRNGPDRRFESGWPVAAVTMVVANFVDLARTMRRRPIAVAVPVGKPIWRCR